MKDFRLHLSLSLAFAGALLGTQPVWADGFLLPHPPHQPIAPLQHLPNFAVKHHRVTVQIQDQIAKTSVDQVFHNPSHQELEGTYLFPVPEGAVLSRFAMEVDGKMQGAQLLQAEEARRIYEDIVRRRVDPGLLEYAGQQLYRARVFPIPARGDKAMKLGYEQVLTRQDQLHHYRYGLSTEKFSSQPLRNAAISVEIESKQPLKNIYSPSHEIAVQRLDEYRARVSWEATQVKPDTDFDLYWTTAETEIGATLLSYKPPGEDGYFMLLASPKVKWAQEATQARQMTYVVDTSGSMSGEKIEQASEALAFSLSKLAERDQFQVISFSDMVNPLTPRAQPATSQHISGAVRFARDLEATGGTNINEALLEALRAKPASGSVPMLLFLTDGDPTVGVTDFNEILKNVRQANGQQARLFVFGVGDDVNIPFLERLARDNHGTAEFVRPEENIETKVSHLISQISHPILSAPRLSYGSMPTYDVLPSTLPDFFKGSQLLVVGRYRQAGTQTVELQGQINGQARSYRFANQAFASGTTPYAFLPRLWASRRIGALMDQIRLKGQSPELITEVVRLSKQYGIITEYTSFLVREEVDVRSRADAAPMAGAAQEMADSLLAYEKGTSAISQSRNRAKLQNQAAPTDNSYLDAEGNVQNITQVKYVSQRAFYLKKGVWQDSLPADKLPVVAVARFSPLYFALAAQAGLKDILALGDKVEFVLNGHLVRIDENGAQTLSPALKQQLKI
ncbi:MAG: VIT and vWA domain-containing protein [Candidatus Sericytochromatia bacterium]